MQSPITSIIRSVTRDKDKPLNILTCPTHESYELGLSKTGHNFYALRAEGIKDWNTTYRPKPSNYFLLEPNTVPDYVDFDLVLSQNKFGQFQILSQVANRLHLPLVSLEHTLPMPQWSQPQRLALREMRGNVNVFISEYSLGQWQWDNRNDTTVIHHMIDTEVFYPTNGERKSHILSVVNDWINRDWCCGFRIWQQATTGLPVFPVGDTAGLSKPASSTEELVRFYQNSKVFINTSTISPIPTALLEAMACGCACVSTATCMIPEIIKHGYNGLISNDPKELNRFCKDLLQNDRLAKELGRNAAETIRTKFSPDKFISRWNEIFRAVT